MRKAAPAMRLASLSILCLPLTTIACGETASTSPLVSEIAPGPLDLDSAAPPSFATPNGRAVPIDFKSLDLSLVVDAAAGTATGRARIRFASLENGLPMLDMWPDATAIALDGEALSPQDLTRVRLPDQHSRARVLSHQVSRGIEHELVIDYVYPRDAITRVNGGVDLRFSMTDMGRNAHFLERYSPANFEFDQFRTSLSVRLESAGKAHAVFTNGDVTTLTAGRAWRIEYPAYYTSSSPYLHITASDMKVARATFASHDRNVPVTVYGPDQSMLDRGLPSALATMQELEDDYGAYAHAALLLFVTPELHDDGMEHAGAAITDLLALPHEVTHSWFARSVMPGNGNAGWIDEAIASWRDRGYPSRPVALPADPIGLGARSAYRRDTSTLSYEKGSALLSAIDHDLKSRGHDGMKAVLRSWFERQRNNVVSSRGFQDFVGAETGLDYAPYFDSFVNRPAG